PLPVWQCRSCGAQEVMGSYAELFARTGRELPADPYDREQFDPHRPYVDTPAELDAAAFAALPESERPLAWLCPATTDDGSPCGGLVARVDDVIDAWFDSGAMSFAQHHYRGEALPGFDPETGRGFPADFI